MRLGLVVLAGLLPLGAGAELATASPALSPTESRFVAAMRAWVAEHGVIRRPQSLAELKASPQIRMKYREKPAHLSRADDAAWERFALSLGDAEAAKVLARQLPGVAWAARIAGDPLLADHVRAQLAELATWDPLQRAGWSGGSGTRGAWLGTGWAVRAIHDTLNEATPTLVPEPLRLALVQRLEAEIAGIREDWAARRTWFARIEAVSSNQWALPLEALALASLQAGLDRHRDDYEFALAGLRRTLDAQGPHGECVEGLLYAGITFESLLSAAGAAQAAGDDRLIRHPWFRHFPTWYLHHRQPGGYVINAFDAQNTDLDWNIVALCAARLNDPAAHWALAVGAPAELPPSLALQRVGARTDVNPLPLPPFAVYPVAARVNWLESVSAFERDGANRVSGFWMRGGHASDAHDHEDRGHVNFIVAGRPVLIEAGLASYGIPEHPTHFKGVAGHNVLEVETPGGAPRGQRLDPAHRAAPLTVHRLEATGGEVTVDASGCYAGVTRWVRTARWDARQVTVRDEVELPEPGIVRLRWHLGEPSEAAVRPHASGLVVGNIRLHLDPADGARLETTVQSMPDATRVPGRLGRHATVVLSTNAPTRTLVVTTRVSVVAEEEDSPEGSSAPPVSPRPRAREPQTP